MELNLEKIETLKRESVQNAVQVESFMARGRPPQPETGEKYMPGSKTPPAAKWNGFINAEKTESPTVKMDWRRNSEFHGIEVFFTGYPGPEVVDELKDAGFRWHSKKRLWFIRESPYGLLFVEKFKTFFNEGR